MGLTTASQHAKTSNAVVWETFSIHIQFDVEVCVCVCADMGGCVQVKGGCLCVREALCVIR